MYFTTFNTFVITLHQLLLFCLSVSLDDLCSLPVLLLSPHHTAEEPLGELAADALPGPQPRPSISRQVGAIEAERETAEYEPLERETRKVILSG